jgi:hypothetical protein
MRYSIFGIILLLNNQAFSTTAPDNITLSNAPLNACFSANASENLKTLKDPSFLNFAFPSMEEIAKKACNYKIKPQSITVSVGFISATWETDKLCK